MTPHALLDENVSLRVAGRLKRLGYEVLAISEHPERGMSDEQVFGLAANGARILITRDHHFTNPVRFPPGKTGGILYLTAGNLRGEDEARLVEQFLGSHERKVFAGRFVFLSLSGVRIR